MFITLALIFATAIIATPAVAPAVRRLINTDSPKDKGRGDKKGLKRDDKNNGLSDDELSDDGLSDLARALSEIQEELYPEELSLKTQRLSASSNSKPRAELDDPAPPTAAQPEVMTKRSLLDVQWSGGEPDAVEAARETKSADELFAESGASRPSVRARERARAKRQAQERREASEAPAGSEDASVAQEPVVGIDKPSAARPPEPLVTRDPSEAERRSALADQGLEVDRIEQHHIHSARQKLRAIEQPHRAPSRPRTVIPLQVTQAPTATPDLSHFEVMTPAPHQPRRARIKSSTPERIAIGERAWRGEQPLYISFDQFFSLDSLISLEDQAFDVEGFPRMSRRSQRLAPRRRASARRRMRARRQRSRARRARSRLMPTRASIAANASSLDPNLGLGADPLSGELTPPSTNPSTNTSTAPSSPSETGVGTASQGDSSRGDTSRGDTLRAHDASPLPMSREGDELDDEYDLDSSLDDDPPFEPLGGGGLGWEQSMPEWRSLLGGGHLLAFNFKLNQRRASAHRALTESSLEDTLVLQISEGVTQPRVTSHHQERPREVLDEIAREQ